MGDTHPRLCIAYVLHLGMISVLRNTGAALFADLPGLRQRSRRPCGLPLGRAKGRGKLASLSRMST